MHERNQQAQFYSALSGELWIRLVLMLAYALAIKVGLMVVTVLAVVQFVFALLSGGPNPAIGQFCGACNLFMRQAWDFICFVSEDKPFPFQDWPGEN
ncbi:MAG: DUF4389 domain-containing protein [Cellvibrionaceae bacterium]|nr:DUF4389 domain-containing protein [Cellvibrionaceae bacterium]MCV6625200.1 DUF4389 domain-containing protein [Cellvibrionaceae bacterium]